MTATPEQIIAHVGLLRAVDRLLREADEVRQRRDALDRLLQPDPQVSDGTRQATTDATRSR